MVSLCNHSLTKGMLSKVQPAGLFTDSLVVRRSSRSWKNLSSFLKTLCDLKDKY